MLEGNWTVTLGLREIEYARWALRNMSHEGEDKKLNAKLDAVLERIPPCAQCGVKGEPTVVENDGRCADCSQRGAGDNFR